MENNELDIDDIITPNDKANINNIDYGNIFTDLDIDDIITPNDKANINNIDYGNIFTDLNINNIITPNDKANINNIDYENIFTNFDNEEYSNIIETILPSNQTIKTNKIHNKYFYINAHGEQLPYGYLVNKTKLDAFYYFFVPNGFEIFFRSNYDDLCYSNIKVVKNACGYQELLNDYLENNYYKHWYQSGDVIKDFLLEPDANNKLFQSFVSICYDTTINQQHSSEILKIEEPTYFSIIILYILDYVNKHGISSPYKIYCDFCLVKPKITDINKEHQKYVDTLNQYQQYFKEYSYFYTNERPLTDNSMIKKYYQY